MPPDILVKEEFKSIDDTKATDNNEFVIDNSIVKNELPQNNTINNNVNNNPNIAWSVPNIINQNNNPQNIQGNIPNPNMYTNQSIPRPININNISKISDYVEKNQIIATVGGENVYASLSGILRGIIYDNTYVKKGLKIADIDPRKEELQNCYKISDKARCIAGGTLEALLNMCFTKNIKVL